MLKSAANEHSQTLGRRAWIDQAKGLGIVLVVFGHTWRGVGNAGIIEESRSFHFLDRWIYSFHMPLFFFLSGLFVVRSASKTARQYFKDKSLSLLYPFIVWSLLLLLTQSVLSGHVNSRMTIADIPHKLFISPTLWFLPVLFLASSMTFFLRARVGPLGITLAFVALWIFWASNTRLITWSPLYFLCENGIYLTMGAVAAKWLVGPPPQWTRHALANAGGILVVAAALTACVIARFDRNPWLGVLPACLGVGLSLLLTWQVSGLAGKVLGRLGEISLPIYVSGMFASAGVRIILDHVLHQRGFVLHIIVGTVAGLVFPWLLVMAARRCGVEFALFGRQKRPSNPLKSAYLPQVDAVPSPASRMLGLGRRKRASFRATPSTKATA